VHHTTPVGAEDCNDADPTIHPAAYEECGDGVDSDCSGIDCRPCAQIVVGLLPGYDDPWDPNLPWLDLHEDWATYGTCPLQVHTIGSGFSYLSLEELAPTVLVASNPSGSGASYTPAEIEAVERFVQDGKAGMITSYLIKYNWKYLDEFTPLVGLHSGWLINGYQPIQTEAEVLDPTHPLAARLPPVFTLSSHAYAQNSAGPYPGGLLEGAVIPIAAPDDRNVVVAYQGPWWRGVMFSSLPDYQPTAQSTQLMYNAVFWASGHNE